MIKLEQTVGRRPKSFLRYSKEIKMRTLDSFYNPDEQQAFQYHQKLLKVAEQERLARKAMPAFNNRMPSQFVQVSLKERLLSLFSVKPGSSTLALKDHK